MGRRTKKTADEEIKKPIKERMSEAFDLPKDIVLNLPRLVFTGNRELFVENYRGIVSYSECEIQLNTSSSAIKVTGKGLGIKNIAAEQIILCGDIRALEFII